MKWYTAVLPHLLPYLAVFVAGVLFAFLFMNPKPETQTIEVPAYVHETTFVELDAPIYDSIITRFDTIYYDSTTAIGDFLIETYRTRWDLPFAWNGHEETFEAIVETDLRGILYKQRVMVTPKSIDVYFPAPPFIDPYIEIGGYINHEKQLSGDVFVGLCFKERVSIEGGVRVHGGLRVEPLVGIKCRF